MQLQTASPDIKFPKIHRCNFYSNRSTFEKVIEKMQRGPDFMEHGLVAIGDFVVIRVRVSFTTGAVWLAIITTAGLLVFIFFPTMTFIENFFCTFLARVKTYTHTKNYTCTFTGFHLSAVTDAGDDDDYDNDADNTGRHSTITWEI